MKNHQTRRTFIKQTAITATGAALGSRVIASPFSGSILGSNEKIRMGFIGVGNRGSQLLNLFMQNKDCEVAALCDIYEPYLTRDRGAVSPRYLETMNSQIPKMGENFPRPPKIYKDYRELLDDKDIDAVCIATPDHWHALQTVHAIEAGKDIYVEKPLTQTIYEGRKMVEAEASGKQIVAVGLNRRGSASYQRLAAEISGGKLGKVTVARAARVSNMFPNGIGKLNPETPPKDFNWDMWLGPRAYRDYQYNIAPYMFRWWQDYSSQMGNWGVHYMDVIRWMVGETAPVSISAHGGKYVLDHDGDIPDTMQVTFEFASGMIISFAIYEASSGGAIPQGEIELRGTKATVYASERGYSIVPARAGQFQRWDKLTEAEEYVQKDNLLSDGSSGGSTGALIRNFLDCVKNREAPLCTLEDGHRSTSFAHLANIALATGERLQWDADAERFVNSKAANEMLHYEYRKPWKL
ncbi:Tat (twin-arginine translocation) pathway signal sequence [Mariniphaga anaerophila]|uniref:Tat (Twin-arginine translocation) pathway signal sequence n=1 Tax=Mariniphaga anaerophila TaxID=1484053 RepID=A0A1M4ZR54_9BACT|nr:Gfo/Idh/MocA family oxidoreductase [Mariniphaga anaerophila]SHF20533.1 Tat (twin-arginine translocation) pathway signal sequence [Mariniphaga anaerophila]